MQIDPENVDVYMKSQSGFAGTDTRFLRTMSGMQDSQARRLS